MDLEEIPVHDLGNIQHTVNVKSMLEMVSKMWRSGDDILNGGGGDNTITGGPGNNTIIP